MICFTKLMICTALCSSILQTQLPKVEVQPVSIESTTPVLTEGIYAENESVLYTYTEMQHDIVELTRQYPQYISFCSAGTTKLNRDIYLVTLGNPSAEHAIFIQGSIHAREYMTTQLIMNMISEYAKNATINEQYKNMLDTTCYYFVPMTNPDGVYISQMSENGISDAETIASIRAIYANDKIGHRRFQSYQSYLSKWKANANGVDINRNFDAGWSNFMEKETNSSAKYKGAYPGSEVETQALMAAFNSRKFDCVINYHAAGEVVYYDTIGSPAMITAQSGFIASLISHITGYEAMNCKSDTDCVQGGFGDWVVLNSNTPSVAIEIGKGTCPLAQSDYPSIWQKNKDVLTVLTNYVHYFL